MSSWDPNLGLMLGLAVTHCVLLEHYYSVYFPWWFDRKNRFTKTANDNDFFSVKWQKLKLHLVISQKNCLCLTSLHDQIFKSFWKPNPWMNLLEFFFLLYQFLLYFLQFNIASGSYTHMTILSEIEFFNFLWLIWVHYLPLPPI